jgi:DNA replication and repair protein RecF
MYLSRLTLDHFRNFQSISIEFPPEGMILVGPNGSGKTNLLEAIFYLCTARSQRQATRDEMIRFLSDYSFVEGVFARQDGNAPITVSSGFSRDKKTSVKIDGVLQPSFSKWFGHSIAIPFGPDDVRLVRGMPRERRSFLDMLLCQIDASYLENLIAYKKNCLERNILLSQKRDDEHLDVYEERMAVYGAALFLRRQEFLAFIQPHFARFYREISGNRESASIDYKPSIQCDLSTLKGWENVFYSELKKTRKKDIINGFSSAGPQRDDILLCVNDKPAKLFASQGQCTTLTLSLRMCSVLCGEAYKKDTMIFLFDDALTYLDGERTSRIFPLVKNKGQIFLATSSDQGMTISDIPRSKVADGQVRRL